MSENTSSRLSKFIIGFVFRLVCAVIVLSETERRVNASGLGHLLSPELASNVLWFLHRFCESYFVISEEYYTTISPNFQSAWGIASPISKGAQTSLLGRVKEDLIRYNGEISVTRDAINLLLSLVDSSKKYVFTLVLCCIEDISSITILYFGF